MSKSRNIALTKLHEAGNGPHCQLNEHLLINECWTCSLMRTVKQTLDLSNLCRLYVESSMTVF